MPIVRIEPVKDAGTGKYFLEIYFPADAGQPFVTTRPRYQSVTAAETDVIAILAAAGNNARTEPPESGEP